MAISPERKAALIAFAQQLQAQSAPKTSPTGIAKRAGIRGPVTKGVGETLQKTAITETGPEETRAAEKFQQTAGEREASLLRFPGVGRAAGTEGLDTGVEISPGEDFIEVPVARTGEGGIQSKFELSPEVVLQNKVADIIATGKAEAGAKLEEGQRAAQRSLSVVSTTLNDFSKILVDSFDEGGFGDIIKASKTALKQKFAGGLATKNLVRTSEIPGKKVEIITKMMPLLTQQGDKPGSVRLVSTVFERLSDTLPGANQRGDVRGNDISLEEARGMLSSTILSMLRFAQAIQSLGITNEDVDKIPGQVTQNEDGTVSIEKRSELGKLGETIEAVSQQFFVEGSPEEQAILDFISQALKPLDDKIAEENRKITEGPVDETTGLTQAEAEELARIDEELAGL